MPRAPSARLATALGLILCVAACTSQAPDDGSSQAGGSTAPGRAGSGGSTAVGGPGGTGGAGGPASPPPPVTIEPLPLTTFAFYRQGKLADGKDVFHLWVRDVVTGTERLVNRLDDGVSGLRSTAGDRLSISPDRRWIALSAGFRYGDADLHLLGRSRMIWKVSADGQQLVRISPPIADWRASCTPTLPASSDECSADMFCDVNSRKCTFDFWTEGYEHPVWSPDGQTIFAHFGVTACDNVGCQKFNAFHFPHIALGKAVTMPNQPMAPARNIPLPQGSPCSTHETIVSPDGSQIVAEHSRCFARDSSGLLVAGSDGSNPVEIPRRECDHMEWRADGKAVYCARNSDLLLITIPDGQTSTVLTLDKTMVFLHFTLSTDGRWMVAEIRQGDRADLYAVDLQATPLGPTASFKPLSMSADDYWPAF
jgi:hypothetical protein